MKHLDSVNKLPGGAPIVCFHNMDLENLDVEICFPVASPVSGKDDIVCQIKYSLAVTLIHKGVFNKLVEHGVSQCIKTLTFPDKDDKLVG